MKKKVFFTIKPYLLIAPAMILFLIFYIYPVFEMIRLSFFEWNMIAPVKKFVGLQNYQNLFRDKQFLQTIWNTVVYMVCNVGLCVSLGLLIAVHLKENTKINGFLQSVFFCPYIVSLASISLLWMWLMNTDFGLLNAVLNFFRIPSIDWLGSPRFAMMSLVLISVWKGVGYDALILLAALQSIPPALYEADALDRSNGWRTFHKITLPMVSPTLFFLAIVNIISSFNVFETIQIITQGGPQNSTNSIVFSIYQYGFQFYKIGYASAMGGVLLIIVSILTILYFQLLSKKVHYQ